MLMAHFSDALGHLVRKGQPDGGARGLGISPVSRILSLAALRIGFATGTAERSISV